MLADLSLKILFLNAIFRDAMDEIQTQLASLHNRGWSDAAISDELGVSSVTVFRWKIGKRRPENHRSVLLMLRMLGKKKRIPKKRRVFKKEIGGD